MSRQNSTVDTGGAGLAALLVHRSPLERFWAPNTVDPCGPDELIPVYEPDNSNALFRGEMRRLSERSYHDGWANPYRYVTERSGLSVVELSRLGGGRLTLPPAGWASLMAIVWEINSNTPRRTS